MKSLGLSGVASLAVLMVFVPVGASADKAVDSDSVRQEAAKRCQKKGASESSYIVYSRISKFGPGVPTIEYEIAQGPAAVSDAIVEFLFPEKGSGKSDTPRRANERRSWDIVAAFETEDDAIEERERRRIKHKQSVQRAAETKAMKEAKRLLEEAALSQSTLQPNRNAIRIPDGEGITPQERWNRAYNPAADAERRSKLGRGRDSAADAEVKFKPVYSSVETVSFHDSVWGNEVGGSK